MKQATKFRNYFSVETSLNVIFLCSEAYLTVRMRPGAMRYATLL